MSRLTVLIAAALLVAGASHRAATQALFQAGVDLVAIDICATDRAGQPVNIEPKDVAIFDNGVRQQIALLSPGDRVPLAVTLLVDSSESMHGRLLERAGRAAAALVNLLPDSALVEVMAFNTQPSVLYSMGRDHGLAVEALARLSPGGGTALYNAIMVALGEQQRAARHRADTYREVIVLLTDGENTEGRIEFDVVLDEARRSGVLVYPVVLPPYDAPSSGPPWTMTQLALDSGGKVVAARSSDDLTAIYEQLASDLRNLYRVGYVPSALARDGAWHEVQVRAVGRDIVLRTRSGYFAPGS